MTSSDLDVWQNRLAELIADVLLEYRGNVDDELKQFAVDCHPWNGIIALALLTSCEYVHSPFLAEAAEIAAWKHYDFGTKVQSGQALAKLAFQMRIQYESTVSDRSSVVTEFFRRCSLAIGSRPVHDALLKFRLSSDFRVTVPHPDTDEDFYPSK